VPCVVDRICAHREVDAVQQVVNVITEPFHGRIIVLAPLEDKEIVPFGGALSVCI
jgi:hypothetical protein